LKIKKELSENHSGIRVLFFDLKTVLDIMKNQMADIRQSHATGDVKVINIVEF